jgi:hypothetical protein
VNSPDEPPLEIWPDQDLITVSFNPNTMRTQPIQDDWLGFKAQIEKKYGHLLPIMAFIDWGAGETPLTIFASLPLSQQIVMLKLLHDASVREGLSFVYPLRGGAISSSNTRFDIDNTYDASKQGTLNTIMQMTTSLASNSTETLRNNTQWLPDFPQATDKVYSVISIITAVVLVFGIIALRRPNLRTKPL